MYDCDFSVTIRGVAYAFIHVASVSIDDPESTNLTRGANAGNKIGIAFTEGVAEPKRVTVPALDIPKEMFDLLKDVYKTKERVDFNCISRADGSSKIAKNSVLGTEPMQLTMDETPDSMQVSLIFVTFDLSEVHKT